MPILFCNVGWMNKYNGIAGDSIERGGKYNKHSIGHEVCNFTNNQGFVYGYVQPVGESIRLEKLGASKKDGNIEGVTVVWTAGPESGGTVVLGWYEDATVYRDLQLIEKPNALQRKNGVTSFRVKAQANKATLLPVEQRELIIPRAEKGGIGQSNVWFADKEESQEIVGKVLELIKTGGASSLPDVDQSKSIMEGNPRLVAHLRRERNAAIVKQKKSMVLNATGKLCCEICGFDFKEIYGDVGEGFCEVHHIHPLHKSDGKVKTELKDLAIICSNCHRIIHRADPMPTIKSFAKQLRRDRV
jgi:5-methylcytosine-specific restriction protein A